MAFPGYKDAAGSTRYVKTAVSTAAGTTGDPDIPVRASLPVAVATTNVSAPSSNTAATVTFSAAGAGISHVFDGIAYSYSGGTPTAGNLLITDDGSTIFTLDITAQGPGTVSFAHPMKGTANKAVVVTLAAGGSGVSGKVNILGKRTEA